METFEKVKSNLKYVNEFVEFLEKLKENYDFSNLTIYYIGGEKDFSIYFTCSAYTEEERESLRKTIAVISQTWHRHKDDATVLVSAYGPLDLKVDYYPFRLPTHCEQVKQCFVTKEDGTKVLLNKVPLEELI